MMVAVLVVVVLVVATCRHPWTTDCFGCLVVVVVCSRQSRARCLTGLSFLFVPICLPACLCVCVVPTTQVCAVIVLCIRNKIRKINTQTECV